VLVKPDGTVANIWDGSEIAPAGVGGRDEAGDAGTIGGKMKLVMKGFHLDRVDINRAARWLLFCAVFVATVALGDCLAAPTTVDFPDFPFSVAVVDLGQSLTINVDTTNDGGRGVTWTCEGDACTKLTSTSRWATFYAAGITGTATITATSIKHPKLHKSVKLTVYLNAVPNMLCHVLPPTKSSRLIST
jgi:hypothetical protein